MVFLTQVNFAGDDCTEVSTQVKSAEVGSAKVGSTEVSSAELGLVEVGSTEVGSAEVYVFIWMFFSPLIPNFDPLSE